MATSANPAIGGLIKIPRVHVVDITVATGAAGDGLMTIQADASFEWWFLAIQRTSALLKILIAEAGVGNRALIYSGNPQASGFQGIFVDNLAGTVAGNGAFPVAIPYVMP